MRTALPPRLAPRPLRRRSRCLFDWDADDASLDAVTGHVGTLTRTSSATALDALGATYTAPHSMARWESRALGGVDRLGLRLSTDDLTWTMIGPPRALSIYVHCVELGTRTTANAGLLYLGNNGVTGARLVLDSDGANYRATWHNGSASDSVTLSTGTPGTGVDAELLVTLSAAGVVSLSSAVGGTEAQVVGATPRALPSSWGSGAVVRANRTGSSGTQGSTWLRRVKILAGVTTLARARTWV